MVGESRKKTRLFLRLEKMGQEVVAQSNKSRTDRHDPFEPFFMMLEGVDKTDTITEHDTLEDLMAGERTWWVGL